MKSVKIPVENPIASLKSRFMDPIKQENVDMRKWHHLLVMASNKVTLFTVTSLKLEKQPFSMTLVEKLIKAGSGTVEMDSVRRPLNKKSAWITKAFYSVF